MLRRFASQARQNELLVVVVVKTSLPAAVVCDKKLSVLKGDGFARRRPSFCL